MVRYKKRLKVFLDQIFDSRYLQQFAKYSEETKYAKFVLIFIACAVIIRKRIRGLTQLFI